MIAFPSRLIFQNRLRKIILFSILSFTSCINYTSRLPVEYDYSYEGNFSMYNTFGLMKTTHASEVNGVVEKAIRERMKILGYIESDNPQLVICFKIFTDGLMFYRINQPNIEEWVLEQNKNRVYDREKLSLKMGTLLILFFDREKNRAIWQGYPTAPIDFSENRSLRNAVNSTLD